MAFMMGILKILSSIDINYRHGGVDVAIQCEKLLHKNILTDPSFLTGDIEGSLKNGFSTTDKEVLETAASQGWTSGSTVVVTILQDNYLYVADVGDSEAVLATRTEKNFEAVLLSQKQKPSDPSERDRIKAAGNT
jgi:protein phosphatase 1L